MIKVVRTINNSETISSKDYEQLREVTEDAIDHIRSVDPTIRPQLTLSSQKNFVDEIEDQTLRMGAAANQLQVEDAIPEDQPGSTGEAT